MTAQPQSQPNGRHALIIATDRYESPALARQLGSMDEINQLVAQLRDPQIGDWNVEVLINRTSRSIASQIAEFFERLHPTDSALMYLSGCCFKVNDELYFPLIDTNLDSLSETALSMRLINDVAGYTRAGRMLELFDLIVPADIGALVSESGLQPPGYRDCIAVSRTLGDSSPTLAWMLTQWFGTSHADPQNDGYLTSDQLALYLAYDASGIWTQLNMERVTTGSGIFSVARAASDSGSLLTWLSSGGVGPAFVRLPAAWWSVRQLADAANRWFKRFRNGSEVIDLIGVMTGELIGVADTDIPALRRLLEDPGTWLTPMDSTVEAIVPMVGSHLSSHRPGSAEALTRGRAVVRAVLGFALAQLDPSGFEQVLMAGLERMVLDPDSRRDEFLLDDIPVWLAARDETVDDAPQEFLGRVARLLGQIRAPSVVTAEVAIYLALLIDKMRRLIRLEPLVVSGSRLRFPPGPTDQDQFEVSADELIRRCHRLVVLAPAWSGKTLLAASAALDSARAALTALGNGTALAKVELPIFTTCSDLQVHGPALRRSVVNGALAQLDPFFETLFRADIDDLLGQVVPVLLVLDALDEVRQPIDDALREIDTWHWRIVLTSRPSAWKGQLSIPPGDERYVVAELVPMRDHLRTVNELVEQFERTGDQAPLERARQILDQQLRVTGPPDQDRPAYLSTQLWLAERTGDPADLERSVRNLRAALAAEDDPHRPRYQEDLAHGLRLLYDATGDPDQLDESIRILARAIAETAVRAPEQLCDLTQALLIASEWAGEDNYLDEAVTVSQEAAQLLDATGHSGLPWFTFVLQAELLRQEVGYTPIATTLVLWTLYMDPASTTRELIGSVLRPDDAEAALAALVGWDAIVVVQAPESFSDLSPSANLRRVLAAAAEATGQGSMITDRELLAGLVAVRDCEATRWLVRTCGLSAERLDEVVSQSLHSEESLAELFWRARTPSSYALRLELPVAQVGLGGVLDVFVRLEPALGDEADDGYVFDAGSGPAELNLLVRATGFRIEGDDAATLSLDPRDSAGSGRLTQSAVFQLTALRPGQMTVSCSVFRGSDYETVLEGSVTVTHEVAAARVQLWASARVRSVPAVGLTLEVRPEWREDLSVCTLVYWLTASRADLGLGGGLEFRSRSLAAGWLDRVRSLLAAAVSETTDTAAGDASARLRSFGQYLGELVMPAELQSELAALGRAHTLQVIADEDAWAPWELVHDGAAFLAER